MQKSMAFASELTFYEDFKIIPKGAGIGSNECPHTE